VQPRQSTILQTHFIELYGGLKQGNRELSLITSSSKCPVKLDINNVDLQLYIAKLFEFIVSNPKKCCPVKWWSTKVVEELLQLHTTYSKSFGVMKQDPSFLAQKQQEQRSKFMMDQKNREALLKKKQQFEDEERREAAKSRKVLADSSLTLADFLHKMSDNNNSSELLLAAVNKKIKVVEEKVTKAIDDKLGSFLAQMCEMLNRNHQSK
jgi:hypothetical protein